MRSLLALMALLAVSTACATTGAVPRPFPGATGAGATAGAAAGVETASNAPAARDLISPRFDGRAIAQFALGFRGVPYRLGGADPGGFDCSGLVQYVFAQYGLAVPRVVEEQYEIGDKVRPSEIRPGDLIFFNTRKRGDGASHVAIALGSDSFVHAPNSTGVVRIETLGSAYWGSRYVGARRISPSSLTATR
jgi:cell wall-associated NlpC family hydrolase